MTSSIIQFHAAPDELADFVEAAARELGLYAVAFRFQPSFRYVAVSEQAPIASVVELKGGPQVVLMLNPPVMEGSSQLEFYDRNPDFVSVHFGKWLPIGLRQSSIGFRTDDPAAITVGKEIIKRFKKISQAGVRVVNPSTGVTSVVKSFRFTEGAKDLENQGVQMLPDGGNLITLGG
jgi:hypothetical protein